MKRLAGDLSKLASGQYALLTVDQIRSPGATRYDVERMLRSGEWERVHRGVYRSSSSSTPSPYQQVLAACLAAGPRAVASHRSAAWLWRLTGTAPACPSITVPFGSCPLLAGVDVHRSRALDPLRTVTLRAIPCCDALRTLIDLAESTPARELSRMLDQGMTARRYTVAEVRAEVDRRSRHGLRGPAALRHLLESRGFDGPDPSALEAEAMRLFRRWGIPILRREVVTGRHGQYRIDFLIAPGLVVEVDGFAYHWSPEAKARDEARRNELRLAGLFLLIYTWRDVRFDERRVAAEIATALSRKTSI